MNPIESPIERLQFDHASFFDLDHTLCRVNTSFRFGMYLLNKRAFPLHKMPYLLLCYSICKIGLMPLSYLHDAACRHLFRGKPIKALELDVNNFLDTYLEGMLNENIYNRFQSAKSMGHYTVLLSNSPDFLVKEIGNRLGFHESAGTAYSVVENSVIGSISSNMEGDDKARYVHGLVKKRDISREQSTAYSDSYLDLLFLEAVGNPIAVNPDNKLRDISLKRQWTIL